MILKLNMMYLFNRTLLSGIKSKLLFVSWQIISILAVISVYVNRGILRKIQINNT